MNVLMNHYAFGIRVPDLYRVMSWNISRMGRNVLTDDFNDHNGYIYYDFRFQIAVGVKILDVGFALIFFILSFNEEIYHFIISTKYNKHNILMPKKFATLTSLALTNDDSTTKLLSCRVP